MQRFEFTLHIPADDCLDYYRGVARQVIARADTGQIVQFPAALLQRFITAEGVHGRFALQCDDENRGAKLQRML